MSFLNGGLTQARQIRHMGHAEFVDHFLAHITPRERQILRQMPTAQTPGSWPAWCWRSATLSAGLCRLGIPSVVVRVAELERWLQTQTGSGS